MEFVGGRFSCYIEVGWASFDLAVVNSELIAVTYGKENNSVVILKPNFNDVFEQDNVFSRINDDAPCWGIPQQDGKLYFVSDIGLIVADISPSPWTYPRQLIEISLSKALYIAISRGKIMVTDINKNLVGCFIINDDEIWSVKEDLIDCPYGLSVDQYGNVFFCSWSLF